MDTPLVIVYADMNCPFCYALHERLHRLGYLNRVDWRLVEHGPHIKYDESDFEMLNELNSEVSKVRNLAPEVKTIVPAGRPNTHVATEIITELHRRDPEVAMDFRTRLYRALWQEGKNYSDPYVLSSLLRSANISSPPISLESRQKTVLWQQEWEQGDFSRVIPVLVNHEGNKFLGLPSVNIIHALQGNDFADEPDMQDASCLLTPKPRILLAAPTEECCDELGAHFDSQYELVKVGSSKEVIKQCLSNTLPDLIVMFTGIKSADGFSTCSIIKEKANSHTVPVFLVSNYNSSADEISAFDSGADDYMAIPLNGDIFRARAKRLLQNKRTSDLLEKIARLDQVTELPNFHEHSRAIEQKWSRCMQHQNMLSLLFLDVDQMEDYQNHYGYQQGLELLKLIAETLQREFLKPQFTLSRYSDRRFAMILANTDKDGAVSVAENILDYFRRTPISHEASNTHQQVSMSIGATSCLPTINKFPSHMDQAAHDAVTDAQSQGGDKIVFRDLPSDQ